MGALVVSIKNFYYSNVGIKFNLVRSRMSNTDMVPIKYVESVGVRRECWGYCGVYDNTVIWGP